MNQNVDQQQHNSDAIDRDFRIYSTMIDTSNLKPLIEKLLPDQGCIEVQRDVPFKEHSWHHHPTDETIVVLEGKLRFYWDAGEKIGGAGTVISIPCGMHHGSVAQEEGATYLIAFHQVNLPHYD